MFPPTVEKYVTLYSWVTFNTEDALAQKKQGTQHPTVFAVLCPVSLTKTFPNFKTFTLPFPNQHRQSYKERFQDAGTRKHSATVRLGRNVQIEFEEKKKKKSFPQRFRSTFCLFVWFGFGVFANSIYLFIYLFTFQMFFPSQFPLQKSPIHSPFPLPLLLRGCSFTHPTTHSSLSASSLHKTKGPPPICV